eukprot:CAMPEP_0185816878 /NCGR_PEP_ID=MMETSP1322-20130828/18199_1 /TAXON_ID=265543 /ORGANISM="Minutocellus polymorphus, Strain RCC2270" /LENGTH=232 /DNA_ID=CAMNT_0028513859 /DNA_START=48 /DNA_END=746 /DNA_ORIENTATION=+
MPDPRATSQFCAFYSFTGILFMGWVGALLTYQPFYVSGLEDLEGAKSSAFGALGTFIFTFASSIVYLCYDSCCKFKYGVVSTHDTDAGAGFPRGMAEYEVNIELADAVAQRMGTPRIRVSGSAAGGRRPYSDTPNGAGASSGGGYRDVPPEAAPASGNSAHSAPLPLSAPDVMVAGMPRSNSTASAVPTTPTGDLLGASFGVGNSEEEGDWAASDAAESAPSSGNGPVDLLA